MLLVSFFVRFSSVISISLWYSDVCFPCSFLAYLEAMDVVVENIWVLKGHLSVFFTFFSSAFFVITLIIFSHKIMLSGCVIFSLVVMLLPVLFVVSSLSMIGRICDRCENQMMRKWGGHQKKRVSIRADMTNLISLMSRCFMFFGITFTTFPVKST